MQFVVKATGATEDVTWLTAADSKGFRTLGPRDTAEVFHTRTDAAVAVAKITQAIKSIGITFSVELAD
jgi:hypothetical protein